MFNRDLEMESKSQDDNVKFWQSIAGKYDRIMGLIAKDYAKLIERIVSDVKPNWRVLEVAMGTALITLEVAKKADEVIGLDLSSEMVRVATQKAAAMEVENVKFVVGSAYQLEFEDAVFDCVITANALHVMETPKKTLAEAKRVLKPGGTLIAMSYCHGESMWMRIKSRIITTISRFKVYHRMTAKETAELVEASGFKVIKLDKVIAGFPLAYIIATPV